MLKKAMEIRQNNLQRMYYIVALILDNTVNQLSNRKCLCHLAFNGWMDIIHS